MSVGFLFFQVLENSLQECIKITLLLLALIAPQSIPAQPTPCFDKTAIMTNCTPVYLRVNFHFFVDNQCEGAFDVNNLHADFPQTAAFYEKNQPFGHGVAERLVTEMNQKLAHNQAQKLPGGQRADTVPCLPLRLVVGDVQIHCNILFRAQQSWPQYQQTYGQYARPGINIYYSRHRAGGATGEGHVRGPGMLIAMLDAGNTLHEIGHNLDIHHTFGMEDGCPDTPKEGVDWDKNGDGDLLDEKERNWPCNQVLAPDDPWCAGTKFPNKTVFSPCCDSNNVYNNLMGYNAYKNAVTPCQLDRIMTTLSTKYSCNVIAQIGGDCPPPAAVIGIVPIENEADDCQYCLQGGASMNEVAHQWTIYERTETGDFLLQIETDWVDGEAGQFCLSAKTLFDDTRPLRPDTRYKAVLTVRSACNTEDYTNFEFKTPKYTCF